MDGAVEAILQILDSGSKDRIHKRLLNPSGLAPPREIQRGELRFYFHPFSAFFVSSALRIAESRSSRAKGFIIKVLMPTSRALSSLASSL